MKIYLSPSNQPANVYYGGLGNEKQWCERIAKYAQNALTIAGQNAKLANLNLLVSERLREAQMWNADMYIAIHTNGHDGSARGIEVGLGDQRLCSCILDRLVSLYKGKSRGTPKYSFAECNNFKLSAYCEIGFHDNAEDAKFITQNAEKIGNAICEGVLDYLNPDVKKTPPAPAPEEIPEKSEDTAGKKVTYLIVLPDTTEARGKLVRGGFAFIQRGKHLQCGAFSSKQNAENFLATIKKLGMPDAIILEKYV